MKILHLLYESKGDYFGIGGVGIRAYEIYRHLKERHDITLLCKKYPGAPGAGYQDIEGLRHIFVGTESNSLTRTMLSYAYHSALFVMKYGEDFDIIIEEFSPATLRFLEYYSKKPVVLEIQLYIGNQYFRKYNIIKSSLLYVSEKYTPHCYKNIIVPSEFTKKRFGLEGRKNVQVIPNGISWYISSPEMKEKDYILYLGRISLHHKGLDILLDAYREFHRVFPHIKLVVAGDGADRERFLNLLDMQPRHIRENIEMPGWISGEAKREYISNALFLIFPSRYEAQALGPLETMASGKAMILSDISEFGYITKIGAALPFVSGSADHLALVMKDLMVSGSRGEMGQKGWEFVKDYTWDKIALQFEGFLQKVVEREGK